MYTITLLCHHSSSLTSPNWSNCHLWKLPVSFLCVFISCLTLLNNFWRDGSSGVMCCIPWVTFFLLLWPPQIIEMIISWNCYKTSVSLLCNYNWKTIISYIKWRYFSSSMSVTLHFSTLNFISYFITLVSIRSFCSLLIFIFSIPSNYIPKIMFSH